VRRQSEAATALWVRAASPDYKYNESAVAASLCRRTPNHCGVGVCFVTVFTVGEACGGGSLFADGDAFGVGNSRGTFAFWLGLAEGLGSAPKFPLRLAGGSWPL